jgi:hypothetical protein
VLNTILIVGTNSQKRQDQVYQMAGQLFGEAKLDNNPDFKIIEEETSLKIETVRKIQQLLSLHPYQYTHKIVWLKDAHKLTLPAQQALLKTLEEPPSHSVIILTVNKKDSLLTTILSRCRIIELPNEKNVLEPEQKQIFENLLTFSFGQKLQFIDQNIRSKTQGLDFCEQQIYFWQTKIINKKDRKIVIFIKNLLQTKTMLEVNVNPSLAIGNLLLSYPD